MSAAGEKRGLVESTNDAVDIGLLGPSAKKQRKKPVTAKSLVLTKEEFETIKAANVKKDLKAFVHKLNCQVDANWHDGYDKQAETKGEWFEALWQVESSVSDKPEGSEQTYNIMITTKITLDNTSNCYLIQHPISSYSHNQSEWWGRFVPNRYLSHSNP